MVNMLPTIVMPLLPAVWALIAAIYWWRNLSSPWLFLVTAALALFGVQAVIAIVWEWWPLLTGNHFVEAVRTEAEMQRNLDEKNRAAFIQAALVLVTTIPFLFWLKKGLVR
jgi:hypothetical protein